MPLDPDQLISLPPLKSSQALTRKDVILYALGVGVGAENPTDESELKYLIEDRLEVLPSQATMLAWPGFWARDPKYGLDWKRVLAAEQSVEIHGTLPVCGDLEGETRIEAIYDKGAEKGALIHSARQVRERESGRPLATIRQAMFARGDGGFGGSSEGSPKPRTVPDRAPDETLTARTRIDQALLYRLSGDDNPLHADPKIAREAGFERPIFHGMGTFGIVARALLKAVCNDEPRRVRRIEARYSSHVFPGDELAVDVWRFGSEGQVAFQARVPGRQITALANGVMEFAV